MKKSKPYILLATLVAAGIGFYLGSRNNAGNHENTDTIDSLGITSYKLAPTLRIDSIRQQMENDRKTEFSYYLDRHNVEDEGFEMVAAFANGQRHTETLDTIRLQNVGRWKNHQRQGTAISRDSLGRIIIGQWDCDTLVSGIRIDSAGIYQGAFAKGKAEGHGSYMTSDARYFEGHWHEDQPEGFGIQLLENEVVTVLKTGQWQAGKFMGERMNYTSERIYGIDISRYQHGKGRKKFPILWNKLRIINLGKKSKKQISGVVDYPVSFCFIKSTEGTSIRNKYYAQDYTNAHKTGIPVGAYHFFSTKSTGAAQAQWFINNTLFKKGDLPPVLDIEPSRHEIQRIGGPEAMFRHIRIWLQTVERRCKVKPILYVNQMFVNNYLPIAPDLMKDYKVWIARYGEFKPGVKLVVWQLSADGRVNGITGEVDINVFNGYKTQFDEFIEKETIQ